MWWVGGVVAFGACAADALLPTFDAPSEFVDGDVRVCVTVGPLFLYFWPAFFLKPSAVFFSSISVHAFR